MNIIVKNQPYLTVKTPVLVFFAFKEKPIPKEIFPIDQELNGLVTSVIKEEKFKAKEQELLLINCGKKLAFSRLLLVGLGNQKECPILKIQQAVGSAVRLLKKKRIEKFTIFIPPYLLKKYRSEKLAEVITKGAVLADYQFTEYKSDKEELWPKIQEMALLLPQKTKAIEKGINEGLIIAEAQNRTRDYGNQPSNKANPSYLVQMAKQVANLPKVHCQILEKKEMEKLKMGALLGVAQGTAHPPKFIILEYKGKPNRKEWLVFVGKGITFDSGGISLKPSEKLDEMKYDMAGGAAVIESINAMARLKLPLNVVGLVPATENLPSDEAFKPGDILTSASGKTIEVITTDAEGRLILADALHYAKKYKPKAVIDIATLTGACLVALGTHVAGLLGNDEKLIKKVKEASDFSGERVWQLPLLKEYEEQIKSDIADLRNVSREIGGGAITAAAFLSNFIEGYPWAHLDIAGTAWSRGEKPYLAKGATGFGVSLLVELARHWR